jgi:regulator of RNase E activity RraB
MATVDSQLALWESQRQERIRLGDNLHTPRTVEHFASFRRKRQATEAATALSALGFQVATGRKGMTTSLQADRAEPLTDAEVRRFVDEVVTLVEAHGGEYDGWGAQTAE